MVLCACDDSSGGDNSGIRGTNFPKLEADTETVVLTAVDIGESDTKNLLLRNAGGGTLIITRMDFPRHSTQRNSIKMHMPCP